MLISYSLNAQEVYEGQRAHFQGSPTIVRFAYRGLSWILRLFLLGMGLFFIYFDENTRSLGLVLVVVSVLLFFSGFLQRKFATRYFKKNPNLAKEFRVEFSEEGMECWAEGLHTKSGWSTFQRWQESKNLFLVYPNTRIFNIFPKRAFAPGDLDHFRELLARKIPKK